MHEQNGVLAVELERDVDRGGGDREGGGEEEQQEGVSHGRNLGWEGKSDHGRRLNRV